MRRSASFAVAAATVLIAVGIGMVSPLAGAAGSAFVRVNQLGYPGPDAKRAYLMASASEAGATFAVKDRHGATVYSAPIGANLGSWSTAYPFVYALDFAPVRTGGRFTIGV